MTDIPDVSRTAIPWYKSWTFTGSGSGLGLSILTAVQTYKPGVPVMQQLDTLGPPVLAAIATAFSLVGRVTSTAQPLTTTQDRADEITAVRALRS